MQIALVRELAPRAAPTTETAVDAQRAGIRREQQRLHATLAACGVHIISVGSTTELGGLRILGEMLVLPGVAFVSRELAASDAVEAWIARRIPVISLGAPGLLDGRNVLAIGSRLFVGIAGDACVGAVAELASHVAAWGYELAPVVLHECAFLRHACSYVGRGIVLADADRVDTHVFAGLDVLSIDTTEPLAHSVLFAPPVAIASAPESRSALALHGIPWASSPAPTLARAGIALAELAVVIDIPEHEARDDARACVGVSLESGVS